MIENFQYLALNGVDFVYRWIWGPPLLIFLMGVGVYFTFALRGVQFRYLGYALRLVFFKPSDDKAEGDISNFESLMTALAATIGIGNIAGVATAITVGGLGALFWMWVTALVGMAIKYAEAMLAIKYRTMDDRGEMCGGPMYFIEYGLGWKWLAVLFAVFGAFDAIGAGNMLQANSVADVMQGVFNIPPMWTGIIIAVAAALTLVGGIKSIGKVASVLVPFMAFIYIGGSLVILAMNFGKIPGAFGQILSQAFTGQAAFGGFAGSTMLLAIQVGISRGLMTSEAGLGTASIAAAAAKTDVPGRQALISMTGGFLATIIMCSATGLVLAVTDAFGTLGPDGKIMTGASLTALAFESSFTWGSFVVAFGLILFAFTTLIGWAYYGEKCVEYIFGSRSVLIYRAVYILLIIPGAVLQLDIVWKIADICNGFMAIPNLIGLCLLSKVVISETKSFVKLLKTEKALSR